MKKYIFTYNGTPITKANFVKAVPNDWENEIENGEYTWGYYRAEEIEEI